MRRLQAFTATLWVAVISFTSSSHAGTLERFCSDPKNHRVSTCYRYFLEYRCVMHAISHPYLALACSKASKDLTRELDLFQVDENLDKKSNSIQIAEAFFIKAALNQFSFDPTLSKKLTHYREALIDTYRFSNPHSLWGSVLRDHQYSRSDALRFMAIILQDATTSGRNSGGTCFLTPISKVADELNRKKLPSATVINQNMAAYVDFVSILYKKKIKEDLLPNYELFPRSIQNHEDLNHLLYHFYVPAHLSASLLELGNSAHMAFFTAFLSNAVYEFLKIEQKIGNPQAPRWPFFDPLPITNPQKIAKIELNINKIYTGYVGALYGIREEKKAMPYSDFAAGLTKNPYQFIQSFLTQY